MLDANKTTFSDAVRGLLAGDFSRLAPLFDTRADGSCPIVSWNERGLFSNEPVALAEAFSCACFNGATDVVEYFLSKGADPNGGNNTGLNAFHWAANRGQLDVVQILIRQRASFEIENMYGGTVLGCAVWSAIYEPKPQHVEIIEALLKAGANVRGAGYPSGKGRIDELLRRYGAGT